MLPLTEDEIVELSVVIVNKLVEEGLVKDCTDTDDETEFEFQDAIREVLTDKFGEGEGKPFVDFLEYLKPIILNVKDDLVDDKLDKRTIDGLMQVLRAKVEFHEGIIDEQEYERRIAFAYE